MSSVAETSLSFFGNRARMEILHAVLDDNFEKLLTFSEAKVRLFCLFSKFFKAIFHKGSLLSFLFD